MKDARPVKVYLITKKEGSMHGNQNKLTDSDIDRIREYVLNGIPKASLARYYNVTPQLIQYYTRDISKQDIHARIMHNLQKETFQEAA
jgi:hypothetical protein